MTDKNVEAAFAAFQSAERAQLQLLRRLIFEVAAENDRIGPVTETLKWGQPAYVTAESGSGTTLRLGVKQGEAALYVHCGTTLVEDFKDLFGGILRYDGRRAIIFASDEPLPEQAVRSCIDLALTYHLKKRKG
ncbi:DUF1801 domain-containing protein [Kordiimonas sp.]|uniref:DUF1801 domain-containing protein n=1 Tax=Kordiimonas sp. TaxID=1970157 RepID=UPI003A8E190C